jgi:hypothetical protein
VLAGHLDGYAIQDLVEDVGTLRDWEKTEELLSFGAVVHEEE